MASNVQTANPFKPIIGLDHLNHNESFKRQLSTPASAKNFKFLPLLHKKSRRVTFDLNMNTMHDTHAKGYYNRKGMKNSVPKSNDMIADLDTFSMIVNMLETFGLID